MVVSAGLSSQSTGPVASTGKTPSGMISLKSASGFPAIEARLAVTDTRVLVMLNHWNQVPSSPAGSRPIFLYCSATQSDAFSSSSVPPSRPRIAGEAMAKRSRRRSASRMVEIAFGTIALEGAVAWAARVTGRNRSGRRGRRTRSAG